MQITFLLLFLFIFFPTNIFSIKIKYNKIQKYRGKQKHHRGTIAQHICDKINMR